MRRTLAAFLCICKSLPIHSSVSALLELCSSAVNVCSQRYVYDWECWVCLCVLSVFLSVAAVGTHASPPHHDTHQTLFSCSPDLLLTFPPYSPPPTLTHNTTESMFFPSSWTALSPFSVSPPSSTVLYSCLYRSLPLSLSLWLRPRGSLLVGN